MAYRGRVSDCSACSAAVLIRARISALLRPAIAATVKALRGDSVTSEIRKRPRLLSVKRNFAEKLSAIFYVPFGAVTLRRRTSALSKWEGDGQWQRLSQPTMG